MNKYYFQPDCSNAYNTMVRCANKLSLAMSQDPLSLATELFQVGFISQAGLCETAELNETALEKGSRLYRAVLSVVKNNPMRYSDIVDILNRNTILYDDIIAELYRVYTQNE